MTADLNTLREALKHGIKLLNHHGVAVGCMPLHEALAALSRLEAAAAAEYERGRQDGMKQEHALWQMQRIGQEIEAAAVPEMSREDVVRLAREAGLCMANDEWPLMERFASLVRSVPVGEVKPAPQGSGGWQSYAEALERERDFFRRLAQSKSKHERGDVWYWQGDGDDHPESMGNDMVVVIRADQLRALTTPPAPPKGWRMVPVEPTEAMEQAMADSLGACVKAYAVWADVLAAAPQPGDKL